MHKTALRQELIQKRLALPEAEWRDKSHRLVEQIRLWMEGRTFDHYILFRSFRREPCLDRLAALLPDDATYYPRIQGKAMNFFTSTGDFQVNRFGLIEPAPDAARQLQVFSQRTLLIIPAVAYDFRGFRLGYGAGFFDRFLAETKVSTVGVCFDAFLVDELPTETHDQPVQSVITEARSLTGLL